MKTEWVTNTFKPWLIRDGELIRASKEKWRMPVRLNRQSQIQHEAWAHFKETNPVLTDSHLISKGFIKPKKPRIFCDSIVDVFDKSVSVDLRSELFALVADTPYIDWIITTKQIGNVMKMCSCDALVLDMILSRVWLGITIKNQEEADRDVPELLEVQAEKIFLNIDPLLENIDLYQSFSKKRWICDDGGEICATLRHVDWVVAGGESGASAKPMQVDWVRGLRDQCEMASVPFFFKNWGAWEPHPHVCGGVIQESKKTTLSLSNAMISCARGKSGRLLDGRTWDEFPA